MRRKILTSAAVALSTLAVAPATSQAGAVGIEYFNAFDVNVGGQTIPIPSGQLLHEINGDGYHVNWDGANFISAAPICEPAMRFTYGNGAQEIRGDVHAGCAPNGQWKYSLNRTVPHGDACAELWAKRYQVLVARQCHYVYD